MYETNPETKLLQCYLEKSPLDDATWYMNSSMMSHNHWFGSSSMTGCSAPDIHTMQNIEGKHYIMPTMCTTTAGNQMQTHWNIQCVTKRTHIVSINNFHISINFHNFLQIYPAGNSHQGNV